uniref:Major facilitator superfamily (MFS) profile domain-containing protein n=1 Tax=Panagrolaimus sp. JU765 TaxID=591449 RepID=A0AC34PUL4_9BILA
MAENNDHGSPVINGGLTAESEIPTVVVSETTSPNDVKNIRNAEHRSSEKDGHSNGGVTNQTEYGDNDSYCQSLEDNPIIHDDDFNSQYSINEYKGDNMAIVDGLPVPPDGGYGWVIVIAAFMSNFLVDGVANSFGTLMGSFEREFQSSKAATSIIGSLLIGSYLLSGPVAGGLLNRYDARKVVIAGCILTALSFVISTFAPNIFIFYLFFSLLGGIGFGFIYLPAIVVVGMYFESKRALATGIAVAGSGFGTFVMPFLCQKFVAMFDWQITLYIISALVLLCISCGLLYKPLPEPDFDPEAHKHLVDERQQALLAALSRAEGSAEGDSERPLSGLSQDGGESPPKRQIRTISGGTTGDHDDSREPLLDAELMQRLRECEVPSEEETDVPQTPAPSQLSPITEGKALSKSRAGSTHHSHVPNAPLMSHVGNRTRKHTLTSLGSELTIDFKTSRPNLSSQLSRISARSYAQSLSKISQVGPMKASESVLSVALSGVDPKEFNRPLSRQDIFLQGSIRNLKEFKEEGGNFKQYRESQISIPAAVVAQSVSNMSQHGDIADLSSRMGGSRYSRITQGIEEEVAFYDDSKFKFIPLAIRSALAEMIDLTLLKNPIMLLLCLSNILGMLGFYIPFVYIIDLAQTRNATPSSATLLLSIIGITNTFGRVFFGWAADRRWVTALAINNFSLIFCGVLTGMCYFATSYELLITYSCLFGFIVSAYICLTSIVLSDLLGVEQLTNSFGLLVVARGIASLLGTPLAGMAYSATESYDTCFVFAGVLITFSGLVSCAVPFVHRHQRSQMKNEGEYGKEADAQSGKLSVLTERSEENLTEYQRTIQSLKQQKQLMKDLDEARRQVMKKERIDEVHEDQDKIANGTT